MTDKYEFEKSLFPQDVNSITPYAKKDWNYTNDINSSIYSNNGITLVQYDLSSIYNSNALIDPSQLFMTIPLCLVSAYTSNNATGALVAPLSSSWMAHGLKNGYYQLVHGADLIIGGQTVEQFSPYLNSYVNFKLLSEMSQDDYNTLGASLGMGSCLDNFQSMRFNSAGNQSGWGTNAYPTQLSAGVAGLAGGNGLVNNSPVSNSGGYQVVAQLLGATATSTTVTLAANSSVVAVGMLITALGIPNNTYVTAFNGTTSVTISQAATSTTAALIINFSSFVGNAGDQSIQGVQFSGAYNQGYYSRLKKYVDATNGTFQSIYGASAGVGSSATTIMTSSQLQNEFKPYYVVSGNYLITYDIAVIRMCDIFNSMKNLCLTKRFDGVVRLYINTGAVGSVIQSSINGIQMVSSATSSTFTNTCPIIQSALPNTPSGATGIVSGLFIGRATTTNIFGVNLASSNAANPMTACRMYYPQVILKPERLRDYISENQNKKIIYTSILYNQFNAISSGATFSQLIQSGVSNLRGVLVIPYIASTINGGIGGATYTGVTNFAQFASPFDTAPATGCPVSLTGLQVSIGGVNQLANVLNFSYENFIEQVSLYEKLNNHDMGISCGLLNEQWWNYNRMYYVDCSRGNISDMGSPRNVVITFNNNSNVTIDVMCFTEYFNSAVINVESGKLVK